MSYEFSWGRDAIIAIPGIIVAVLGIVKYWKSSRKPKFKITTEKFNTNLYWTGFRVHQYGVRVENLKESYPAKDVRVCILSLENQNSKNTSPQISNIPLKWLDHNESKVTIGSSHDCFVFDIFYQDGNPENSFLQIKVHDKHFNENYFRYSDDSGCILILELQIQSEDTNSKAFKVQIDWDGGYAIKDSDMEQYLKWDEI